VFLLICLLPVGVAASQQLETVTLQLKYYHQFQFAGYYAALEKGFYKEAGLDVKINAHAPGSKSPIIEVLSGTAQYGVANSNLIMERLAGKPVVVLANIFQKSPSAWIVREDSGISSLHDLVGKRVMYNPGFTGELLVMLQVEGIPANKVNLIPSSFNIQDLVDGHIDAFNGYVTNEPYLLQEQGVHYRLIAPVNYGTDPYGDVLFTTESEIENYPERTKAFRLASLKGWQYAMEHSDEIINLIRTKYNSRKSVSHLKFEAEVMRSLILPDLVDIGHSNPGRWRVIAKRFVALGSADVNYDLLNGFIFDPSPKPQDLKTIYAVITTLALLALVFLGVTIWVGRLNARLKKSEQHSRESEENLNEAQKVAHLASWDWEISSDEVTWSDEQYRMFGLEPEEIPPTFNYYLNAINPDDHAHTLKALEEALANEGDYDVEYRLIRKNGEECLVHAQAIIKRDSEGKPVRMIGTSHDITDRRQAEEWLRREAVIFDNTDEGIMVTDAEGNIIRVNKAFTVISGYKSDEVVGKHPKLQQSGRHDKTFYKKMWASISQNGQWRGEIWNQRKNGDIYPAWENITMVKDEQGRLTHYVAIFSDISVLKASEERFSYLAHHDSLTELPNRLRFIANLEQAMEGAKRHKHKVALLYLDLDGFKHINDTLGHDIGDEYLKKIAERLKKCVRAEDTVARIGGDEFTIVLTEVAHAGAAGLIAEKIVQAVRQPIIVNIATIDPSASIGICMYPDDAMDTDGMMKAADAAMYHAKAMGKNCFRFYTADLNSHMIERVLIEQGLRSAFEHEEFELHYQPQVSLADGKITGIEALIRWNHPEQGLLLPGRFIHIADDMSLIDKISQWVLRTTISDYEQWFKNASTHPRIAINITGRQISNEQSITQLLNVLDELVSAENTLQFEFEITESALERIEDTIDVISTLKQRGIIFSIDDFGTGHSSLSRLKQFPIDSLKIDRSFVTNIADDSDDKSIVSAIIAMAHSLNLRAIAEGVETQRQLDVLRALGCDEIQGFYFSKPVPASEIALLLEKPYDVYPS
jgi:diguanylate cyclase (GGDEF)-like protein/PAS domain S-box-containing protein